MTNIAYLCLVAGGGGGLQGRGGGERLDVWMLEKKKVTAFLFKIFSRLISPAKNAASSNEKIQVEMSSLWYLS